MTEEDVGIQVAVALFILLGLRKREVQFRGQVLLNSLSSHIFSSSFCSPVSTFSL